jgi:methylglyoxal synthase
VGCDCQTVKDEHGWQTVIAVLASRDSRNKNEELAQALARFFRDFIAEGSHEETSPYHFLFTGGTFSRLVLLHDPECEGIEFDLQHADLRDQLREQWEWPGHEEHGVEGPWRTWDPYDESCLLPRSRAGFDPITLKNGEKGRFFGFLRRNSTVLPPFSEGGVTFLSCLVVRRLCSIVWLFLSPNDMHWLNPDNLALMRLCDYFRVKRLMTRSSVTAWIEHEANDDRIRNCRRVGPASRPAIIDALNPAWKANGATPWLLQPGPLATIRPGHCSYPVITPRDQDVQHDGVCVPRTIALIAHDKTKNQMVHFTLDYEAELQQFTRILTTGTTGKRVQETAPVLKALVRRLHSGPMGGDIEIATEVLLGRCQYVVFFVDPLNAHPHIDDVRVLFGACMRAPAVQAFTNEVHAREWMEHVVRRGGP